MTDINNLKACSVSGMCWITWELLITASCDLVCSTCVCSAKAMKNNLLKFDFCRSCWGEARRHSKLVNRTFCGAHTLTAVDLSRFVI